MVKGETDHEAKVNEQEKIHLTRQFTWSGWRDLNSRPLDPQSSALPSCATAR